MINLSRLIACALAFAGSGCAPLVSRAGGPDVAAQIVRQSPEATRRWRGDVAVARADFLQKDRSFIPESRQCARERLDRLSLAVPTLTDQQIVAELARVAALADNGHTRAYLLRNRGWWRRYPLRIWKFSDGWRVVAVRPGQKAILGARLIGVNGKSIEVAEAAVRPLYGGPATWGSYMAGYTLTSPDALLGTGIIRDPLGAAVLAMEKDGRRFTARVAPVDEPRRIVPRAETQS